MVKAVLFDVDDTLIDWSKFNGGWDVVEHEHLNLVYKFICESVQPFSDFETYKREYFDRTERAWASARASLVAPNVGRILLETAEALGIPPGVLQERACLEAYKWRAVPGTSVFPDVVRSLRELRDAGLRFGLVTNASQPMWLREFEMHDHGLIDFFPECRFSAADIGRLKPAPEIFQAALDCLGTPPEETVFVGDNPIADIAGAQSMGMMAVLRVTTPSQPLVSGLVVPDAAINTLFELPGLFDEWFPGWRSTDQKAE